MLINHISVSRKGCIDECEARYKYRYHDKKPRDEGIEEPFYFVYGNIVHTIAEEYIGREGAMSLGDVADAVLKGDIEFRKGEKAPKLPEAYKKRLPGHLRALDRLNSKIGCGESLLEYPFSYDLDPPNDRLVVGFIDRVIQKGKKFFLIDYKTTKKGKFRKNKATIKTDLQLRVYANVIRRDFGARAEDITAALYYLEGGDLFPARFSEASLDAAEAELLKSYKYIENKDPEKIVANVGKHCERCDYRYSCPFVKIS
jgi:CRISPR/Cas system-associated exonuclease Cas4 (RecB family)